MPNFFSNSNKVANDSILWNTCPLDNQYCGTDLFIKLHLYSIHISCSQYIIVFMQFFFKIEKR